MVADFSGCLFDPALFKIRFYDTYLYIHSSFVAIQGYCSTQML